MYANRFTKYDLLFLIEYTAIYAAKEYLFGVIVLQRIIIS